ncbi:MAG: SDR family oxidoreductase [Lactobacillus sp.]|jgi:nucleoside-diphosphate-sugar epimerase|nr:SDR family oxidoreductase [Lactobacillus sp.]
MSKIFVVGGSGRVASELLKNLTAAGHQVTAGSRHPEKIIKLDGVTPVEIDLHTKVAEIAKLLQGHEIVYFVAGSRGHDLIQTDAMGAIKTMMAAEQDGIKRYVLLSSMFSLDVDNWSKIPGLEDYLAAKFFADTYLMHSTKLDYTILQPTNLMEKPGTGKITLDNTSSSENPIPDVAKVLADIIDHPNTVGKVIQMTGGDTPIKNALESV